MRGTPDTLPLPPKHQTFPGLNISPPPLRFNHMLLHIPPTHPLYPFPLPFQRPPPDPTYIPYGPTLTDYIYIYRYGPIHPKKFPTNRTPLANLRDNEIRSVEADDEDDGGGDGGRRRFPTERARLSWKPPRLEN